MLIIGLRDVHYEACLSKDAGQSFTCKEILSNHVPATNLLFNENYVMTIMLDVSSVLKLRAVGSSLMACSEVFMYLFSLSPW